MDEIGIIMNISCLERASRISMVIINSWRL